MIHPAIFRNDMVIMRNAFSVGGRTSKSKSRCSILSFTLEAACLSHIGKRRCNHEDNFFFDGECLPEENRGTEAPLFLERPLTEGQCLCVFDGMGGENYGETAAYAAAEQMKECVRVPKATDISENSYLSWLVEELNAAVVAKEEELLTDRMGTTMVALYFAPQQVFCCNVGDSRAYRLREGILTQISLDHVSKMPMGRGRKAPLTQHLGIDPQEVLLEPYIESYDLLPGDRYVLCSDGLTDMLADSDIVEILQEAGSVQDAAQKLVDAALKHGGRDNITVIICRIR